MKVLFIGGTGNISTSVSRLAVERGIELWHLNRGNKPAPDGVQTIQGDISKPDDVAEALRAHQWDSVVNWIAFKPADVQRDIDLFDGKTRQYIFISSASAYQKPVRHPVITESTPLCNPFWDYSQAKIACEEKLMLAHRDDNFPATIVRPSHTYDTSIPLAIGSGNGWTVVDRIKRGDPIVVHGDGTSLWTVTHSDDFAKAFVGLLGHQQSIGHAFHITSDESLTWRQIHEAIGAAVGTEPNIVNIPTDDLCDISEKLGRPLRGGLWGDKSWSVLFDNSKIKRFVPDYCATIRFSDGIKRTMKWFEADPARCVVQDESEDFTHQILQAWNSH